MFENLTVKTRFTILVGVIIMAQVASFLISSMISNVAISSLNHEYHGGIENIQMVNNIGDIYIQNILDIAYQAKEGKISYAQAQEIITKEKGKIDEMWATYIKEAKMNSQVFKDSNWQVNIENKMKNITTTLENYVKNENNQEIQKGGEDLSFLIIALVKDLRQLTLSHAKETLDDYNYGIATLASLKFYSYIVLIITSIMVIGLAIWIMWDITKTLTKSVEIIKKLTVGDLSFQIDHYGKGETGQLLEAMNTLGVSNKKMSQALTAISNGDLTVEIEERSENDSLGLALVDMIQNLKQIIGEIKGEVASLTTSSQEIVNSVSQVATSSAETSAAITETTTSVEELKQTALVTDEKAKDVLNISEETLKVLTTSDKLLQATMEDMQKINEKMGIISERIVKLSEHSQTIGDIISTVNDLAEQSNLLAVNAAIEAAKAGEHGKSFAVVAQEIRTLAEQSKASTIQIRSILNEIQSTTSTAVLATEQGSKAVEKGVKQSAETNESMKMLSLSVTRVTQAANQIAISSQQQFVGVDQVTVAMNNISEATTQLVDQMKQIESAVSTLNGIGGNLRGMANRYTLSQEARFLKNNKQLEPGITPLSSIEENLDEITQRHLSKKSKKTKK